MLLSLSSLAALCAAASAALTTTITPRPAGAEPGKADITGTWKMVDTIARDAEGNALPKPYGPKGMGLVTLTAEGRMMAVLCDGRDALAEGATREYASYCGNYTFDGQTLVTRVDASSIARIAIGGDQVRKVRFEGARMVLTPPPLAVNGVMVHRELVWERISPLPA